MTRIILVRHGESTYNALGLIQGRCDDSQLSEKGYAQAVQVGKALSSLKLNAVYTSPLQRARRTAEGILSQLESPPTPQTSEGLYEVNLPEWENLNHQAVREKYPDQYRLWHEEPHRLEMGNRFPILDLMVQARDFWQQMLVQHPGETVLLVGHSGINRALISTAVGLEPDRYHALQQSNCGISVLNVSEEGRCVIESLNLTGHLGGSPLPKFKPNHQGPRLLLVRHGETEWNRQQRFQGQIDVPLNDTGRQQAQQASEFLRSVKLDAAFSSPMLRPRETAEIILRHHPELSLVFLDDLMEIRHGLWEGKYEHEIEAGFPGLLQQWQRHPEQVQMPEGENLQQVWMRATSAWQQAVNATGEGRTSLVVAHDAVNKAILADLLGLKPEHFWCFKQGNGAVSVIDYPQGPAGPPLVQALNITTYLGGVLDRTAAGAL
ncbi:histidine phosphatase family protein [Leptolyngbya sp. FACHB-261]|nr:histidine phosphatase family protein [Leptolyngbya sp. FACHB-261]